jgi:hypothetical protein
MRTASALRLARVRTEDGRIVGRVFDLRCEWREGEARITHVVYGRRGFWERFGFRRQRRDTLPWSAVVRHDERDVILGKGGTSPTSGVS